MKEDIYKKIDEERIIKALKDDNRNDALVLFKYSSLSKEEFDRLLKKINSDSQQARMQIQSNDIWNQVLNIIALKISAPNFVAWFEQSKGALINDSLIIYCSNIFQRDWLEVQYQDLISSSIKEVTGEEYKISFVTEEEKIHQE